MAELVDARMRAYPCSGEINFKVNDAASTISRLHELFATAPEASMDYTDGLSVELPEWRFNIRSSNTEPLLRLNIEARGSVALLEARTAELCTLISDGGFKAPVQQDQCMVPSVASASRRCSL